MASPEPKPKAAPAPAPSQLDRDRATLRAHDRSLGNTLIQLKSTIKMTKARIVRGAKDPHLVRALAKEVVALNKRYTCVYQTRALVMSLQSQLQEHASLGVLLSTLATTTRAMKAVKAPEGVPTTAAAFMAEADRLEVTTENIDRVLEEALVVSEGEEEEDDEAVQQVLRTLLGGPGVVHRVGTPKATAALLPAAPLPAAPLPAAPLLVAPREGPFVPTATAGSQEHVLTGV